MLSVAGSINGSAFQRYKDVEPNDTGRKQFYEYQTNGKFKHEPYGSENVDPYFFVLKHGKHQFDLLTREYQQMYRKGEWPGFYSLWQDWKGKRWLLKRLCKWYNNEVPYWLDKEDVEPKLGIDDEQLQDRIK